MTIERAAQIASFAVIIVTVGFLGWSIQNAEARNLRAACSVMAGQVVVLEATLGEEVAEDRISGAFYSRIIDRALVEYRSICADVDRDGDGVIDLLVTTPEAREG